MRRYYFPILHKGETQADDAGEMFGSAELAVQYVLRGISPAIPITTAVRARS
ncbi:hypothetical protein ACVW1A_006802 [Bradyrhizobium sp. LB1.3]